MSEVRFSIVVEKKRNWIRVFMGKGEPTGELSRFLSDALAQWIIDNPKLRIISVAPISRDGDTVELHAWFEERKATT